MPERVLRIYPHPKPTPENSTQKDMNLRFMLGMAVVNLLLLAAVVEAAGKNDAAGEGRRMENRTVAGGGFWCMEHPFDRLEGVVSVTSGYTGGSEKRPTYQGGA